MQSNQITWCLGHFYKTALIGLCLAGLLGCANEKLDPCDLAIDLSQKGQYFHAHLALRMGAANASQKSWAKATKECLVGSNTVQGGDGLAEWLKKASEQGDTDAKLQLAFMYIEGFGTSNDIELGKKLLHEAEAQGNESATIFIRILEQENELSKPKDLRQKSNGQ